MGTATRMTRARAAATSKKDRDFVVYHKGLFIVGNATRWGPHFMTQERIMFSNPTPSEPRLSPAATMLDNMLSALTPPLNCASIFQPANPPQVVACESWTISAPNCLIRFTLAESRKPDL